MFPENNYKNASSVPTFTPGSGLRLDLKGSNQAFKSPGKLLHPGYNINHTATLNTTLLLISDHYTGPQLLNCQTQSHLRLRSTSSKPVKYIQAPVVYASNYSCRTSQKLFSVEAAQMRVPQTHWRCLRPCHILKADCLSLHQI